MLNEASNIMVSEMIYNNVYITGAPGPQGLPGPQGTFACLKVSLTNSYASVHYDPDSQIKFEINGNKRLVALLIVQKAEELLQNSIYSYLGQKQVVPYSVEWGPFYFRSYDLFNPILKGTFEMKDLELLMEVMKEIVSLKEIRAFL
jgi:hypothetical protein